MDAVCSLEVNESPGRVYECRAKGGFRNQKIKPLVGDEVELQIIDEEEGTGNITGIFPRKNMLIRPAVANIDQVLLVFAVRDPVPNLNLLDRFLIMMEQQKVPCFVCFNKTDLTTKEEISRLEDIYRNTGYPVSFCSVYEQEGIERLREIMTGSTTVLAGPSGVGKSSLLNSIFPDADMETGQISEKIRRGKHTTRHSELFLVGKNTYLCDTPGFTSLDVGQMEAEDLRYCFPELAQHEGECRFQGCVHIKEPGCRVKDAVKAGEISKERYDTYCLLYQELKNRRKY